MVGSPRSTRISATIRCNASPLMRSRPPRTERAPRAAAGGTLTAIHHHGRSLSSTVRSSPVTSPPAMLTAVSVPASAANVAGTSMIAPLPFLMSGSTATTARAIAEVTLLASLGSTRSAGSTSPSSPPASAAASARSRRRRSSVPMCRWISATFVPLLVLSPAAVARAAADARTKITGFPG